MFVFRVCKILSQKNEFCTTLQKKYVIFEGVREEGGGLVQGGGENISIIIPGGEAIKCMISLIIVKRRHGTGNGSEL